MFAAHPRASLVHLVHNFVRQDLSCSAGERGYEERLHFCVAVSTVSGSAIAGCGGMSSTPAVRTLGMPGGAAPSAPASLLKLLQLWLAGGGGGFRPAPAAFCQLSGRHSRVADSRNPTAIVAGAAKNSMAWRLEGTAPGLPNIHDVSTPR